MRILVTGFEPFGGEKLNASWEAVSALPERLGSMEILRLRLPVTFEGCLTPVISAIRSMHPDAVLCVGQAEGRSAITPERVAINLDDARIPDNAGCQPADRPIRAGGPAAYFATLPVRRMADSIRDAGIPAVVSYTAGTFVCNHLMYGLLDFCAKECPEVRAGFIHVPCLHEQVSDKQNTPSLSREDILRGVITAVEASASGHIEEHEA